MSLPSTNLFALFGFHATNLHEESLQNMYSVVQKGCWMRNMSMGMGMVSVFLSIHLIVGILEGWAWWDIMTYRIWSVGRSGYGWEAGGSPCPQKRECTGQDV